MIKAVLFDMDGTIVNSEKHYIDGTCDYLKENGVEVSYYDVARIIGTTMKVTYDIISEISGIDRDRIIELNTLYFMKDHIIDYRDYLFEDTLPCFKRLKEAGIQIAICSMSESDAVRKCMKELGLFEYVDYFLGGSDVIKQKPDPEIYLKALDTLHLKKEEVLIVEDAPNGIKAGKNAGIYTVARKDRQFHLDQSEADMIIDDLSDLKKVMEYV